METGKNKKKQTPTNSFSSQKVQGHLPTTFHYTPIELENYIFFPAENWTEIPCQINLAWHAWAHFPRETLGPCPPAPASGTRPETPPPKPLRSALTSCAWERTPPIRGLPADVKKVENEKQWWGQIRAVRKWQKQENRKLRNLGTFGKRKNWENQKLRYIWRQRNNWKIEKREKGEKQEEKWRQEKLENIGIWTMNGDDGKKNWANRAMKKLLKMGKRENEDNRGMRQKGKISKKMNKPEKNWNKKQPYRTVPYRVGQKKTHTRMERGERVRHGIGRRFEGWTLGRQTSLEELISRRWSTSWNRTRYESSFLTVCVGVQSKKTFVPLKILQTRKYYEEAHTQKNHTSCDKKMLSPMLTTAKKYRAQRDIFHVQFCSFHPRISIFLLTVNISDIFFLRHAITTIYVGFWTNKKLSSIKQLDTRDAASRSKTVRTTSHNRSIPTAKKSVKNQAKFEKGKGKGKGKDKNQMQRIKNQRLYIDKVERIETWKNIPEIAKYVEKKCKKM